jgi:hypothetical protein
MLTPTKESFTDILTSVSPNRLLAQHEQTTEMSVCISLLGEIKIWLEMNGTQVPVPLKSYRRLELLAYIATLAPERKKKVSSGLILTDVFEHIAPQADVENLRALFQKHTQLLRKEINEIAQEANFPPVRLFQYEKVDSSTKWWLSEECKVVDLSAVKLLYEQMEAAKEGGEAETAELKAACDQMIRLYQGDFLEKHLQQDEFGDADWVRGPFTEYRDMYLQAVWDAAVYEHRVSVQSDITDQDRHRAARRAASLYRTYALHAPKNRQFDLNARKSRRQSERALRGFLRMCLWLMDAQAADGCYSLYARLMRQEFPDWKPNISTVELIRAIRQQSGHDLPLLNMRQPPKELEV